MRSGGQEVAGTVRPCMVTLALMLDLRAKLAQAGVVSDDDVKRVEHAIEDRRTKKKGGAQPGRGNGGRGAQVTPEQLAQQLAGKPKGIIYETTRQWVDAMRLDTAHAVPSDDARPIHFAKESGQIGKLILEPDVHDALSQGQAGIVAYMSHHGLAHAVVPKDTALAIAAVMPTWLRMMAGHDGAAAAGEPMSST